ncbi:SRPBCC domain-containing protein [Dactylosporangium matsuzakiense]|uniref:ATPase n=1 Tax=Dactylosporangium matsuzakiense TaxID=53360 RepID=A0A9W6KR28_9ACTN|nr:SRPBCC domain-containing protein [Dactylosporangium matsuzakiense]UWZ46471.1 SRPBCC domain-containing protein [Dactylosporangium matsuzakiense]GLL06601.1 ATPase [Dactylosporangium matsuzakiense]
MRTRTFTLYIAATPDRVWRALTEPELTRRYYLGLAVESTWQPGAPIQFRTAQGPVPDALYGEILHASPGQTLIYSLLTGVGPEPEPHCWLTWEITQPEPSLTRVALTCDDLDDRPDCERDEAWSRIVSGLKTVLETGAPLVS